MFERIKAKQTQKVLDTKIKNEIKAENNAIKQIDKRISAEERAERKPIRYLVYQIVTLAVAASIVALPFTKFDSFTSSVASCGSFFTGLSPTVLGILIIISICALAFIVYRSISRRAVTGLPYLIIAYFVSAILITATETPKMGFVDNTATALFYTLIVVYLAYASSAALGWQAATNSYADVLTSINNFNLKLESGEYTEYHAEKRRKELEKLYRNERRKALFIKFPLIAVIAMVPVAIAMSMFLGGRKDVLVFYVMTYLPYIVIKLIGVITNPYGDQEVVKKFTTVSVLLDKINAFFVGIASKRSDRALAKYQKASAETEIAAQKAVDAEIALELRTIERTGRKLPKFK